MKRAWVLALAFWPGCGGGSPQPAALTEVHLYKAIAQGDVRYVLLTKEEKTAEARNAGGERMTIPNVGDVDALAALLSKERVEYFMQEKRSVQMPE